MKHYAGFIVHYGELALKGRNRPQFLHKLVQNIKRAFAQEPMARIHILSGRLFIAAKPEQQFTELACEKLKFLPGISDFAPAIRVPLDIERIQETAWQMLEPKTYTTFRISTRRSSKKLPFTSPELNHAVGTYILQRRATPVKMHGADIELHIECMPDCAYMYLDKISGPSGLPLGSSGHAISLLSGGIDSPVASARMMRRGLHLTFVHFHSHPYHTRASQEKARALVQKLARYQTKALLHLVPFGDIQNYIVENAPEELRVVLYRRLMLHIASRIGAITNVKALVTGESLGQVASQTIENMTTIQSAATLPILRPLIGCDKEEITREAERIGTYSISILPDQDCCTLFMPRSPETRSKIYVVEAIEAELNIEELIQEALNKTERLLLNAEYNERDIAK